MGGITLLCLPRVAGDPRGDVATDCVRDACRRRLGMVWLSNETIKELEIGGRGFEDGATLRLPRWP